MSVEGMLSTVGATELLQALQSDGIKVGNALGKTTSAWVRSRVVDRMQDDAAELSRVREVLKRTQEQVKDYQRAANEARDELDKLRNTLALFEGANQRLQEERDALLKATLNLTNCLAKGVR